MTVVNKIYLADSLLQDLSSRNIPNVDLSHTPMVNNLMQGSFTDNYNIVSVININNDVVSMDRPDGGYYDSGCFSNCHNLTTAPELGNCSNLTYAPFLFYNCSNLVNAPSLPNSLISLESTFENCTNLVNAPVIPNSVTNMHGTFHGCTNLVNAPVIPNSVSNMAYTFMYCTNLVNAPVIPNGVVNMISTFEQCFLLNNINNISNSVINMYRTFFDCTNLVNAPVIPNSVTDMREIFSQCYNLVNAPVIPNSVSNIYQSFYACYNLVNAPAIPNSVTDMAQSFAHCINLVNISTIPNSVTNMYLTFTECYNLTGDIIIESENIHNAVFCFQTTSLDKNVLIPFNMSSSAIYTKGYYWQTQSGKIVYTLTDFYSLAYDTWTWYNTNEIRDENFDYLNGTIEWNPNDRVFYINYENDGSWIQEEIYYDGTNNYVISKGIGDSSFTYDSFIEAGYSPTNRVDGVLLKDINDKGTIVFSVTPSQGTSIYVDGNLISGTTIETISGNHIYKLENSNYPIYYGSVNVVKNGSITVTKDLTQITGHKLTINTNEPNCTVIINGKSATTVTSTSYESDSIYSESSMSLTYTVSKEGYTTSTGSVTFNNSDVSINVEIYSTDVDLSGWNYTIDANNVAILEDYIGPDVTTLTIPNLRNV